MKQRWPFQRPAPTLVTTRRSRGGGIVIGRKLPPGEEADPSHGGWTRKRWGYTNRPANTLMSRGDGSGGGANILTGGSGAKAARDSARESGEWIDNDRGGSGVRITLAEALILQDFPPDYPVQGTNTARFLQVGNAIPPGLARAILRELVG